MFPRMYQKTHISHIQLLAFRLPPWAKHVSGVSEERLRVALFAWFTFTQGAKSEIRPHFACTPKCRLFPLTSDVWMCPVSANLHTCTQQRCKNLVTIKGLVSCSLTGLSHGSESTVSYSDTERTGGFNPETKKMMRVDANPGLRKQMRLLRPVRRQTVESRQPKNIRGFIVLRSSAKAVFVALARFRDSESESTAKALSGENSKWIDAVIQLWFKVTKTDVFKEKAFTYRFDFHVLVCLYHMNCGLRTPKTEFIPAFLNIFKLLPGASVAPKALKGVIRSISAKMLTKAMTFLNRSLQTIT